MVCLIDTSVAISLRDKDPATHSKLRTLSDAVLMSVVTHVELEGGVYRDPAFSQARRALLDAMLAAIPVLPFDGMAAEAYAGIVRQAGYSRRKILDRMIAAQALVHRATLITHNRADFADIPGLALEVW